jgi:hypothetical protein
LPKEGTRYLVYYQNGSARNLRPIAGGSLNKDGVINEALNASRGEPHLIFEVYEIKTANHQEPFYVVGAKGSGKVIAPNLVARLLMNVQAGPYTYADGVGPEPRQAAPAKAPQVGALSALGSLLGVAKRVYFGQTNPSDLGPHLKTFLGDDFNE